MKDMKSMKCVLGFFETSQNHFMPFMCFMVPFVCLK